MSLVVSKVGMGAWKGNERANFVVLWGRSAGDSSMLWCCLGEVLPCCTAQAVHTELPSFRMRASEIIITSMWVPSNLSVI